MIGTHRLVSSLMLADVTLPPRETTADQRQFEPSCWTFDVSGLNTSEVYITLMSQSHDQNQLTPPMLTNFNKDLF